LELAEAVEEPEVVEEPAEGVVLAAADDAVESPPAFAGEAGESEVVDAPSPDDGEPPGEPLPRLSVR
jgi:hypothetical protein